MQTQTTLQRLTVVIFTGTIMAAFAAGGLITYLGVMALLGVIPNAQAYSGSVALATLAGLLAGIAAGLERTRRDGA
jgi:hypothetical protein